MTNSNGPRAPESSGATNDDRQKGVCGIKPEFIIEEQVRESDDSSPTNADQTDSTKVSTDDPESSVVITPATQETQDEERSTSDEPPRKKSKREWRKEKLKGQNKQRPPPFRSPKEQNLCPWLVDQLATDPEKKCPSQNCKFLHDRVEYMKLKEPDIGPDCYVFELTGRCPRGTACRFGSSHLTETGINIINPERYQNYKEKPAATKNQIANSLQEKLRRRKYNFSKAERIMRSTDEILKEKRARGDDRGPEKPSGTPGTPQEEKIEKRVGPVSDADLVKLRASEKKKIDWRDKILLSPLTTVGNLPFRRICKEYGADITCGEMALAPKILKGASEEWALVKRYETEDIFGVQICGNNTGVLTRSAQLLNEEADIDFVDLNLGCPIELIYKQGGGSGMLTRRNILESVVQSVSQVLDVPLTIKTRMGVYQDKPIAHNLSPQFRDWGASMITVHGRSREQRYTKSADWEYIERCAAAASPIPVFGNGDVLGYDDYLRVRESCPSVQGITIGRGALIKPWIFTEIKERKLIDMASSERLEILRKYANYGLDHWGSDTRGVETTRRFMLEWISFLHRYIPVGILESPPQRINERPPFYKGRDEMETLMASSNCADWVKISEMFLGKVPDGFHFLPKHRANSWK
ncbi:tRNA-dihydrouridine(47) synthase [NAD(P)(+)]-like [Diachasma alloeum]|uniref:tRNA-dihydrouridine(47) synthase [NAD(P)(+)]-like n=1 Tax=Diachasma alloeum TaxID=454923 RepID=UPI0007382866|nr:tRNA-dihydrouridine(47) synthase [NAD(P)(+)]-like [Diachasma alloeum]